MAGYEIGISGIHAAQSALDIIGNNIANAATEGFHRQEIDLRPEGDSYSSNVLIGQGVDFVGVKRNIDKLLDSEMLRQGSTVAEIGQQLDMLRTIENSLGEMSTSAFSGAMDSFFNSLHGLSSQPYDVNLQNAVVADGEKLAFQLRSLGETVSTAQTQVYTEAQDIVEEINLIAGQIATLNNSIYSASVVGDNANNLLDQRSALLKRLSDYVGIKTVERDYNVLDVSVGNTSIVLGSNSTELDLGLVANGSNYDMTLSPTGSSKYTTDVSGGKLGGLFSLKNSILRDIDTKLDNLAVGLISEMNNIHVRGVGTSGSFTELTGWAMTSQSLSEFSPAVSDGTINIRVIDSSGNVTRSSYTVTAASDTMTDIRDWLGGLTGISNTNTVITDAKLHIEAESGYKFDFLGGAMTSPPAAGADNTMAGFGANAAPEVHISGNYTGTANETYTFTVATSPAGQTGLTIGSGSMAVEVRNGAGSLVKTISVGSGYVAGTAVPIENGISVSFDANGSSPGYLNDGELFRITAVADSDTSGVLAAMGINAFFSGSNSESIAVCDRIKASTSALAVYGHAEPTETGERITGNENLVAMSRLGDAAMTSLGGLSPKEYYRTLATDIGKDIAITEIKHDNALGVWQNMRDQRDGISGVDLNTEATRMLVFERMFQSMAKYLNTISKSQDTLMSIIY